MNKNTSALVIAAFTCILLEVGALVLLFNNMDFENDPVTTFETVTNWISLLLIVGAPVVAFVIYHRLRGKLPAKTKQKPHSVIPAVIILAACLLPFLLLAAPEAYSSLRRNAESQRIEANREASADEAAAAKEAAEVACIKNQTLLYDRTYGLQSYINTINSRGTTADKQFLKDQADKIDDIRAQCQGGEFDGREEKRRIQVPVQAIADRAQMVKEY